MEALEIRNVIEQNKNSTYSETNGDSKIETHNEEFMSNVEDEEVAIYFDTDLLLDHGIAQEDVKELKRAGLNTIKGILMCTKKKLVNLRGLNEEKVNKIRKISSKITMLNDTNCFMTALELSDQRKQVFTLTTGSDNLDNILGGGVESMSITEVFGESRTGKTQLSHTLCVTAQIPGKDGYEGGKVVFIDTEHTFRPERIRPIAERFQLEYSAVLENILYARAYNSEHHVVQKFHEEPGTFKLLIVDSVMALFRVDYTSGEIPERQSKLGLMLSRLQKISEEYNVAVFLTNQITSDLNHSLINDVDVKPVGGNILAHSTTTRIALKKEKGNVRIARVYDSPNLEEKETEFIITGGGIANPKNFDD